MNELDTKKLDKTELEYTLELIRRYVNEIKNKNHNGDLFTLHYCNNNSNKIINMKQFIDKSIKEALDAEYSRKKWEKDFERKNLKQQAKEKLIARLKDHFEFISGPPDKVLNSFLSYVRTTVESSVRNYLKRLRKIELKNNKKYKMLDQYDDNKLSYKVLGSNIGTPEQELMSKESEREIDDCIDQLTEKQKEVLNLSRFSDKSQKEIALQLGISQPAVSKLLDKALDNLSQILLDREVASEYRYYFAS